MIAGMRIPSLGLVVLVACSNGKGASTTPAPQGQTAGKCAQVADHLLSLMSDTARGAPTEDLDRMRNVFTARCEQDGWSAEAQQCFLGVTSLRHAVRCEDLLTESQMAAFGRAIDVETGRAEDGADPEAPMAEPTAGAAPPPAEPMNAEEKKAEEGKLRTRKPTSGAKPSRTKAKTSDPCEGGE
jgi:hypothetical protein